MKQNQSCEIFCFFNMFSSNLQIGVHTFVLIFQPKLTNQPKLREGEAKGKKGKERERERERRRRMLRAVK